MIGRKLSILCAIAATGCAVGAGPAAASVPVTGTWYLGADDVTAAQAELPATLSTVRVAVLDSGIDGGHPAFAHSIAGARSFVGGNPLVDTSGHGTFVAGEIVAIAAAATASTASPIQLLIGKITAGGSIDPGVEARAIYWAVDSGARVINLSLAGVRDPMNAQLDTYSAVEAAAVRYAIAHRAVVVAAVGNGDAAPSQPWPYASWPAALPHVIGVSALAPDGSVPPWSNRDVRFNELAAPGTDIVSTFPRNLTALNAACPDQGYSDCGPAAYQPAEGTSFAAPQVSAAAALLVAADPRLTPDQVSWLLERNADDADPGTGCSACSYGRDPLTGWGTLDVAKAVAALKGPLPPASPYEPTNNADNQARPLPASHATMTADLDYWENPVDVYRVRLARGATLWARLSLRTGASTLALWKPGTPRIEAPPSIKRRERITARAGAAPTKAFHYRAPVAGWYYLEVRIRTPANSAYTLAYAVVR